MCGCTPVLYCFVSGGSNPINEEFAVLAIDALYQPWKLRSLIPNVSVLSFLHYIILSMLVGTAYSAAGA